MSPGIRVLIVEDHATVRDALRCLLSAQSDVEVVGEAADGRTAIEQAAALMPDVIVLDLSLPEMNGLVVVERLRESVPAPRVVVLTRHHDAMYVQQMLAAGASAYVLKQSPSSELLTAIRAAATGARYVDGGIRQEAHTAVRMSARPAITGRESTVLKLTATGYSNKEIGATLGISVKTVEVHKANAMRKLGLDSRPHIVRYAALQGWLQDP